MYFGPSSIRRPCHIFRERGAQPEMEIGKNKKIAQVLHLIVSSATGLLPGIDNPPEPMLSLDIVSYYCCQRCPMRPCDNSARSLPHSPLDLCTCERHLRLGIITETISTIACVKCTTSIPRYIQSGIEM